MLEPTGAAALFVHHTIRSVKADANWRAAVGGATNGLVGTSRSLCLVGLDPADPERIILCPVKDAYGECPDATAFEMLAEDMPQADGELVSISHMAMIERNVKIPNPTALVVVQGKGDKKSGPSAEKAAEAGDFLRDQLKDGAKPVSDYEKCAKCHAFWSTHHWQVTANGSCPGCGHASCTTEEGVQNAAIREGVSWGTIKRARPMLLIESSRKASKKDALPFIRLPAGHPALVPGARTELP